MVEEIPTQVTTAPVEAPSGEETPQAVTEPAVVEPGTETEPKAPEPVKPAPAPARSYTEEEVRRITSTTQQEAARDRQYATRLAMEQQIGQLQAAEQQARNKDKGDVDSGIITESEAQQRAQTRYQYLVTQAQAAQMEGYRKQQESQLEQYGRVIMAKDLAEEYGVNADELLKDKSVTTPIQLQKKAADLALKSVREQLRKARTSPESFDRGPGGSSGKTMSKDTAMERYIAGEISAVEAKASGVSLS